MIYLADARWIAPHGIGRFAQEVIARLPDTQRIESGPKLLSPLEPFWLSFEVFNQKPQVYFSPGFNPPLFSMVPVVFTIGDLIHLKIPEERSRAKNIYYNYFLKHAVHKAFAVLTFSEFSKKEIVEWSGVNPQKVAVVGCGVGPEFSTIGDTHQPGFPYIFYMGNQKPHKNLQGLLKGFAHSKVPREIRLLVRASGVKKEQYEKELQQLGIADRVEFLGLIPDERLPSYYRGALALAFPTLYEGFGLPPLEAMACGTPVMTSNVTSLPEVVGNAAVLIDPYSTESIAQGLEQITSDYQLREHCISQGLMRAKQFSWEITAQKTLQVLKSATER